MSYDYSDRGLIPLHVAARSGTADELLEILKSSPDVNVPDYAGRTALHFAVEGRRSDNIEVLVNAGARCDVDNIWGFSPLRIALFRTYYDAVKMMMSLKPNLDDQNGTGYTALHITGALGKLKIVDLLLESGARFDITDHQGRTFMCYLMCSFLLFPPAEDLLLLEKILHHTQEIIIIDQKERETAAHYVCKYVSNEPADIEAIKITISNQEYLNITNHSGKTPLNLLLDRCSSLNSNLCVELIRFMVQRGAYVTKKDCEVILMNDILCNGLFGDLDFCALIMMHLFDHELLPQFYSLLHTTDEVPPIEVMRMSLLGQVERVIRNDIQSEIGRKGYCNVSSMVTTSLSKRCIEVYVSHWLPERSWNKNT